MAYSDYRLCDVCGGKAFYDARLNYDLEAAPEERLPGRDYGLDHVGAWVVLCQDCAKTHDIVLRKKEG